MTRVIGLWVIGACAMAAQPRPADALGDLQRAADKQAAAWDTLAKGLDARLARLLPCDPRVTSAIEEVSRASEARLSALSQYLQAASAKAKDDAEAVKPLLASREAIASEMSAQRAEAEIERAGIETQLADLGLSAKQRATLEEAQKALTGLAAMLPQRAGQTEERSTQADTLAGILRELDGAYQARQTTLASEEIALASETQRWGVYYTARLARARIECTVIQAPAPVQRKKQ